MNQKFNTYACIAWLLMLGGCSKNQDTGTSVTDFPTDWHAIELADMKNSYTYQFRIKSATGGVEVVGDIDGDQRLDKVRLMQKNDRSACAIFATLNKKSGTQHIELIKYDNAMCTDEGQALFVDKAEQRKSINAFQFYIGAYEKGASLMYFENGRFVDITESD
jgi:hypothetical protein